MTMQLQKPSLTSDGVTPEFRADGPLNGGLAACRDSLHQEASDGLSLGPPGDGDGCLGDICHPGPTRGTHICTTRERVLSVQWGLAISSAKCWWSLGWSSGQSPTSDTEQAPSLCPHTAPSGHLGRTTTYFQGLWPPPGLVCWSGSPSGHTHSLHTWLLPRMDRVTSHYEKDLARGRYSCPQSVFGGATFLSHHLLKYETLK